MGGILVIVIRMKGVLCPILGFHSQKMPVRNKEGSISQVKIAFQLSHYFSSKTHLYLYFSCPFFHYIDHGSMLKSHVSY